VFAQTLRHDFVNYDDDTYVYENSKITDGPTFSGLKWAFTHPHSRNWHPLTSFSHMLDCQLFGLNAGGHHFTNLFLHTIAALLLFFVVREMTGSPSRTGSIWRSAFVAALFAIHPQHVESVAWIAERKDVLSGVFFMLTLLAYTHYTRRPSPLRYLTMSILFALGLMSKPMLVTVPFVLLLLDYWPLQRTHNLRRLVVEKIPLLVLAAGASTITYLIQKYGRAHTSPLPLLWRIENALVSYINYIRQMIWPVKLAPFYPHPENALPLWEIGFACAILLGVSAIVFLRRRNNPYLVTGWFWFLGMLIPVIGIVQVGAQGWADRYMYLPHIGLSVMAAWGIVDLAPRWPYRRQILSALAATVILALAWRAWVQTSYWRDNETLWGHTLAVTSQNHVAHNNLGSLLFARGQFDAAFPHHEQALAIRSQHRITGTDFLLALYYNNVASGLRRKGRPDEAIALCQKALQYQPDYDQVYLNWGGALIEKGKISEAIPILREAVRFHADDAAVYNALADAFRRQGMEEEAIAQYEKALQVDSRSIAALNNLAWILATSVHDSVRNGARAVTLAEQAVQISRGKNPLLLHKLAAAYAESGNFAFAVQTAEHALQMATEEKNTALTYELKRNLGFYRANRPLRDTRSTNAPPSP
jgi:Flp pilus assembly protein TadD